jgi:hypothetical protein
MRLCKAVICAVVLVSASLLLGSCYVGPAHPSHGYVYAHGGIDMVFDSGLGLYIVTGYPDYYFFSGRYYRYHSPYWEYSSRLNGPWKMERYESLPRGLRERGEYREPPPGRGGEMREAPGRGRGEQGGPPGRGRGRGRGPE